MRAYERSSIGTQPDHPLGGSGFPFLVAVTAAVLLASLLIPGGRLARDRIDSVFCGVTAVAGRPAALGAAAAHMESLSAKPRPTTEIISSEPLAHVPGKRVTMVLVKFPPGSYSPEHHHGGSVSVYVLSGAIRSQLAGGPAETYKAGDTFFEPLGSTHLFAENVSTTEPAEILAVFVADQGATLTTYH